jgi:hypothetical protein
MAGLRLYVPGSTPSADHRDARWWRRRAAYASAAAVLVPTPMVVQLILGPLVAPDENVGWALMLWVFSLPFGLLLWAADLVIWGPLIGTALGLVWAAAARVPGTWSPERARAVLVAGCVTAFVAAAVGRALVHHRGVAAGDSWAVEVRWALLPLVALGATVGACLARARSAPGTEAFDRPGSVGDGPS